ncbi:MAG TPA: PaaI family thioesterase [Solirubrobacterales bacterium]|jgi:1,4-dihydroxy-2-naphthoyl-CoA hydrolase
MSSNEPDISPFSGLLGVEWISNDPEEAEARIEVRDELKQPYGYLHGGVIIAMIDELCSRSTVIQVIMDGSVALGQSLNISLLQSVKDGTVTVKARARHRGKTTWVWDAEATDGEGRLCALARATVAVRPFEAPD